MSGQGGPGCGKIIVAFDGSKDSVKAVDFGCSLAEKYGSTLIIVYVYSATLPPYGGATQTPIPEPVFEEAEALSKEKARGILTHGIELAEAHGTKARGELLEANSTVQAIIEFAASEKVDLIIVGTRGMTGFKKLILGSVSSGLVTHSECSVLVVR
jgi:nucleotide-binding universal stress UspA family protein